jgi:hypothetical protein
MVERDDRHRSGHTGDYTFQQRQRQRHQVGQVGFRSIGGLSGTPIRVEGGR